MKYINDYFNYVDKVCVVTGAASGIGLETAKLLVDLNANVYCLDINKVNIKGIKDFIETDLSSKESIDKAFSEIPEHIDSFFGVAGLSGAKTNYYKTFTVNFIANKYITEEYLKKRMQKDSSICYVTSTGGRNYLKYQKEFINFIKAKTWKEMIEVLKEQANPDTLGIMAYPLSKRALNYYMETMSIELGQSGIRVNALLPGSTKTGMKKEFEVEAGGMDKLIAETGVAKRLATPSEMAEPLVFLNSNMARFISGQAIIVDYANNALIDLKLKKDRLNTKVGLKLFNSKIVQDKLKKQLEPLKSTEKHIDVIEPNTELLKTIDESDYKTKENKKVDLIEPTTEELNTIDEEIL